MSIFLSPMYSKDGLIRPSYVYMLLCQDIGPVYVKVGLTDNPDRRLMELRRGCPVTPHQFATLRSPNRVRARHLEKVLHNALTVWRTRGEWYSVPMEDRETFNLCWKTHLSPFAAEGYPIKWERVAVKPLMAEKYRLAKIKAHHDLKRLKFLGLSARDEMRRARY